MFKTQTGEEFLAADERELVRQMHQSSRAPSPSDQKWMYEAAQRAKLAHGTEVRHDTAEHFVSDLLEFGLLSEIVLN